MGALTLSSVLRTFCAGAGALQLSSPAVSSRRAVLGGAAAALLPLQARSDILPDALEDLPRNAKKARIYTALHRSYTAGTCTPKHTQRGWRLRAQRAHNVPQCYVSRGGGGMKRAALVHPQCMCGACRVFPSAQAYLQYLPQLQLDGDFFVFELEPLLALPGRWDRISEIVTSTDIGSAASISRLEREFITPMRQISLAFPPDMGGEEMQTSIDAFQKAMYTLASQAP